MRIAVIFFTLLFLLSCSKEKHVSKDIEGEWKPVSLRINTINGIATFVDATGTFTTLPSTKKSNKGTYSFLISYENGGQTKTISESGTYLVRENDFLRTTDSLTEHKSTVNYVNKEDMEFEIPSLFDERYLFIFKKKQ